MPIGSCTVHIFWEDHKILRNLHLTFVLCSARKSKVKILQNCAAFSEYMVFKRTHRHDFISRTLVASRNYQNNCVHEKWSRSYAGIHSTVVTWKMLLFSCWKIYGAHCRHSQWVETISFWFLKFFKKTTKDLTNFCPRI